MRDRGVPEPRESPGAAEYVVLRGAALPHDVHVRLWFPTRVGDTWRTIVSLEPAIGCIAFNGSSSLYSLVDACHLLRWILSMLVDFGSGDVARETLKAAEGSSNQPDSSTVPSSLDAVGAPEKAETVVGQATLPFDVRSRGFLATDAVTPDDGEGAIRIEYPYVDPDVPERVVCSILVGGQRRLAYSVSALCAIVNACAFVERQTDWAPEPWMDAVAQTSIPAVRGPG